VKYTLQFGASVFQKVLLFGVLAASLAGKTWAADQPQSSAIESHFAAAQKAQHVQDYATAEHEYQAVIAIAPGFAEVHMNLGLVYQLQDRPEKAMPEFLTALKLKPDLVGANFFLGIDYCRLGEGASAVPYLSAAIQSDPNRIDTWLWLATAQEMTGQFEAEVTTLDRVLETRPKDVDALYRLGTAYEKLGKQEVARLQKAAPGSSRSEQLLAESYATSIEWPSAVIHYQNALADAPQRPGLHAELGEVFLHAGKVTKASEEFDAELKTDPRSLRALVRRGEARLILGNVDGALQDWDNTLTVDPLQTERILGLHEAGLGDASLELSRDADREAIQGLRVELQNRNTPAAHLGLAFLALQHGNLSDAAAEADIASAPVGGTSAADINCNETEIRRALDLERYSAVVPCARKILASHTSSEFRIRTANALLDAGEYDLALKTLDTLEPSVRDSSEAAFWRARSYEKLATASYLHLYQADPDSYRLHELAGDLEAAKNNDTKAIEEYRAAIALKPASPNLHYSLGHLLWKNLKVPEARAEFEAELALSPRHAGALDDLGDTYLLDHQPNKALPYLNRALAADPSNSDIHRDLGTAFAELGDNRKAEEHFKIAVVDDHDGVVHYKLARVYQALGETDNAAREFQLSTELNRKSHERLEKQTERLSEITRSTEAP
jgi:tetratricopeptide (TPR) repeat protein